MSEKVLAQAMNEYAAAIRGDWSNFDGRSERDVIEGFAAAVLKDDSRTIHEWRAELGICQVGAGHWCGSWSGHCSAGASTYDCNCPCTVEDIE